MLHKFLIAALLPLLAAASSTGSDQFDNRGEKHHAPVLTPQQSGTTNRLQAISPVNSDVVWASGVGGTWVRTIDGGSTWQSGVVAGAEGLQFRDVQAVSERVAYLLSAGTGTDSRIYKTEDAGRTWSLQFQNQDPNAFYDCFAFWTPRRGIATSDSVNGRFPVLRTRDGETWADIGNHLPAAQPGEASFAASGTCVATYGRRDAWIATGGAAKARILATTDGGDTWEAFDTPVVQGTPTSGVFTVDFRDPRHGILGAGELAAPTAFADTVARSQDGGRSWQLTSRPPFPGAIYGLSYAFGHQLRRHQESDDHESVAEIQPDDAERRDRERRPRVVITGPAGAAWTPDEGDTWFNLPNVANYWAVAFGSPECGWLVGTDGRILKIDF